MSLKLVPFKSLGAVSYWPYIVTVAVSVAVCKMFSVKEMSDPKPRLFSRSRYLSTSNVTVWAPKRIDRARSF